MNAAATPATPRPAPPRRRRFGLEAPLPADRTIIERAVRRHLAEQRPRVVVVPLRGTDAERCPAAQDPAGLPHLLLLAPGGRVAFVRFKTQAETLPRAHRAFADLCRGCGVPLLVLRSLAEARAALDRLSL